MRYNIAILTLFISFIFCSCTEEINEKKVPKKVKSEFYSMFNKATDVEWEIEDEKWYVAEFEKEQTEISVLFDTAGIWKGTQMSIEAIQLPLAVQKVLARKFPKHDLEECARIESVRYGIFYEVELEKGRDEIILHYNEDADEIAVDLIED